MRNPYAAKDHWRRVRRAEIEQLASEEIRRYQAKFGRIETPWIPVEKMVEFLWEYGYLFGDPMDHGAVPGALAVLRPDLRLIVVSDSLQHPGRESWSAGHEGGHIVLHLPESPGKEQMSLSMDVAAASQPKAIYCRDRACGYEGSAESGVMYREAEFFAGCLLMPRDRYLPLARKRLIEELARQLRSIEGLEEVESDPLLRARIYTRTVENAVRKMATEDLNGTVSMQAQRIRLSGGELGLIREITDPEHLAIINDWDTPPFEREYYEFGEHFAAQAAKELGLGFSPGWRGSTTLVMK